MKRRSKKNLKAASAERLARFVGFNKTADALCEFASKYFDETSGTQTVHAPETAEP